MSITKRLRRLAEPILSIGAYEGEPETKRAGRRVFIVAFLIANVFSVPQLAEEFADGYLWVGVQDLTVTMVSIVLLIAIHFWPHRIVTLLTAVFVAITAGYL